MIRPARRSMLGPRECHRAERARPSHRAFEGGRRRDRTILEDDEERTELTLRSRDLVGEVKSECRARSNREEHGRG